MSADIKYSCLQDPNTWMPIDASIMKISGAEIVWFEKFEWHDEIFAKAKGRQFRQRIGEDGPLAAAGRLAMEIRAFLDFGKRRRTFRTKQRNIRARIH